jgi:hypothetical protein
MSESSRSLSAKLATATRYAIVAAFGVFMFSGLNADKSSGIPDPTRAASAYALGGISAAPGYLCVYVRDKQKFNLIDTASKRILSYSLKDDELRLVSARRIDADLNVVDSSNIANLKSLAQGGNGSTVAETEAYLAQLKKMKDVVNAADPKYNKKD